MAKKWIQAMHMKKGALTKKAHASGMTPMAFANAHKKDKGKTGKESKLAETLISLHKGK